MGENPSWRVQKTIPAKRLIPVEKLDARNGEAIYSDRCVTCHGTDSQGVEIGDRKAGPLWGPDSWNDGAGAARVYTGVQVTREQCPAWGRQGSLQSRPLQRGKRWKRRVARLLAWPTSCSNEARWLRDRLTAPAVRPKCSSGGR